MRLKIKKKMKKKARECTCSVYSVVGEQRTQASVAIKV